MDRSTFESANPILDDIADKLDEILDSDEFSAVRVALARLSETVGSRYSVNLTVCVDVFDAERSNALPLLNVGLSTSKGNAPHKTYAETQRPQKYVVEGEIQVIPRRPLSQMLRRVGLQAHTPILLGVQGRLWVKKLSCSSILKSLSLL